MSAMLYPGAIHPEAYKLIAAMREAVKPLSNFGNCSLQNSLYLADSCGTKDEGRISCIGFLANPTL
jgi:hypothetical protein